MFTQPQYPVMEFHVARAARVRYGFAESLFSLHGNVIFANFRAAREFVQRINEKRDLLRHPEQAVRAGQMNALGLIDEILHYVVAEYRRQTNPQAMAQAMAYLERHLDAPAIAETLRRFVEDFPPVAVYRGELTAEEYLAGATAGVPHTQAVLEEMLLLWLTNVNPACDPYKELFDDSALVEETAYTAMMDGLHDFFATQPVFGPDHQPLVELLHSPAIAVPHSLTGQLEYLLSRWGKLLGAFLYRILGSLDYIKEEEKAIFLGPGPARVYDFSSLVAEPEHFSPDKEWMPTLVLLAKNAYVWLHQLSEKYRRDIYRLDQIPDEELDALARWGITGLWLIGLWERSTASQRIKQLCGNPDAVASAYSLKGYDIAGDLGGEEAMHNLRERAWARGIRMASDMVPNHMGIDSHWVIEHPDWFVSLPYSPFPSYSFNGPNLSQDDRVGIYIEDHYYTRSDAAVVFKRVDHGSGSEQFIYHGNDGTSMPWNDTAQLNYLLPQVREAVIQTILHVARQFPVIRFDAAMTLAKKHYQRLWFPEPGSGGAIPSRAEYGLTRPQFEDVFPVEFWREVVDRVAQEVPDTLLLAEAFWLMEGYFVRTLGMHRVYNSAFMNMLRDEDNGKYRLAMKNTLEFDPEILKRYVNFMNNPDERTAVDQFGKGDKYFGISVLMSTLPGLPMFGHGQIEGFSEKYGMEFRRAYWQETPDPELIARHEREVFPLLKKRYLFAEVKDFTLYDVFAPEGGVNEDVFAYSNRAGDERGLVVYNNRYSEARGWIRTSVGYAVKHGDGSKHIAQRTLGEGLGLTPDGDCYLIFRDAINGLEYIRNSRALCEQGMYIELHAYQYQAFIDFNEVRDNTWRHYAMLAAYLNGRGVPSIQQALLEIVLQPVHQPFLDLLAPALLTRLLDELDATALDEVEAKARTLAWAVKHFTRGAGDAEAVVTGIRDDIAAALALPTLTDTAPETWALLEAYQDDRVARATLLGWAVVRRLGQIVDPADTGAQSRAWLDEWVLSRLLANALQAVDFSEEDAARAVAAGQILTAHQQWFVLDKAAEGTPAFQVLSRWLHDEEIQRALQINRYQGILWFNQEAFDALCRRMLAIAALQAPENLGEATAIITALHHAAAASDFQVETLLQEVEGAVEVGGAK